MRIYVGLVAALAAACATVTPCQASILGKHLTFDGNPDTLESITRSSLFDGDGDGVTSVGDVVYGFASISDVSSTGDPSPDEISVLFSAEITGSTVDGSGNTVFLMGAVDPTSNSGANAAFTLSALIADAALAPKVDPGQAPAGSTAADAVAVVVSATGINPLSPEFGSLADFGTAGFQYEATVGIDPASTTTSGDFLHFQPIGVANIVGVQAGGLSVFDSVFPSSVIFLPVTATRLDSASSSDHDVRLFDGVVLGNSNASSPWDFTGSSKYQLNAVPEPKSIAAWAVLAIGAVALVRRRRTGS